jgi:hypothetical protein
MRRSFGLLFWLPAGRTGILLILTMAKANYCVERMWASRSVLLVFCAHWRLARTAHARR